MAYNEQLADRVRIALEAIPNVEEKKMMGGLCFMVNGKMCMGIMKDELMCRIDPAVYDASLERPGCHEMAFTGKVMKGFVLVSEEGIKKNTDFQHWINLCLQFNPKAKASKKK